MPLSRLAVLRLGVLATLGACSTDRPLSPASASDPALNVVPPAKAYTAIVPAGIGGYLSDVNDSFLVSGSDGLDAVVYDVRGASATTLPRPGWHAAGAHVINAGGAVGGFVNNPAFLSYPAVWVSPRRQPLVYKLEGTVRGLNDHLIAVGSYRPGGIQSGFRAFVWNVRLGSFDELPVPKGTVNSYAEDINNDGVIIGDIPGWGSAMWRLTASGYSLIRLNGFSTVSAIDGGYGVVGMEAAAGGSQRAVYGSPHLAGAFLGPWSAAYDVNGWGIAVGTEMTAAGVYLPWIGDRNGTITYLPHPSGPGTIASAQAVAVNNCGFAVGISVVGGVYVPTLWDPGC